jgi:Fe-only nitrogenase accessory protein AnfO
MMQIAILLDQHGAAARFSDGGTIYVFEKHDETWISERKLDFLNQNCTSMSELRRYMFSIVQWLGDCKVFAAQLSTGYYRVILEGYGIGLWSVEGIPQHFITQIESFYQNNTNRETINETHSKNQELTINERQRLIIPIPHKTGFYRVDLRDVTAHKTTLNSKELLLPFFKETPFRQLEIICDHVPRWFQSELSNLGLWANVESSDNEQMKIVIVPAKNTKVFN